MMALMEDADNGSDNYNDDNDPRYPHCNQYHHNVHPDEDLDDDEDPDEDLGVDSADLMRIFSLKILMKRIFMIRILMEVLKMSSKILMQMILLTMVKIIVITIILVIVTRLHNEGLDDEDLDEDLDENLDNFVDFVDFHYDALGASLSLQSYCRWTFNCLVS